MKMFLVGDKIGAVTDELVGSVIGATAGQAPEELGVNFDRLVIEGKGLAVPILEGDAINSLMVQTVFGVNGIWNFIESFNESFISLEIREIFIQWIFT
ncbi:MAG TPA: hypothetical protein VEC37_06340, partial [Bacillota bacterium]|nr:hypothetical protein [Bacillota bacterium]